MKILYKILKFFIISFLIANINLAHAAEGDSNSNSDSSVDSASEGITNVLCHVINIIQGNTGKSISILVIISLAIGLFLGKVTWGVAIAVAVGMGVLFGANTLVGYLADGNSSNPCVTSANN
jgi:type IV secretion system protein VirB2